MFSGCRFQIWLALENLDNPKKSGLSRVSGVERKNGLQNWIVQVKFFFDSSENYNYFEYSQ